MVVVKVTAKENSQMNNRNETKDDLDVCSKSSEPKEISIMMKLMTTVECFPSVMYLFEVLLRVDVGV